MRKIFLFVLLIGFLAAFSSQETPAAAGIPGTERLKGYALDHYIGIEEMPNLQSQVLSPAKIPGDITVSSPDTRYVFQSYRFNNWEVYFSDGDYNNQVRLTFHPSADIHPQLNRGSNSIIFASKRSGVYELYSMNTDGSNLLQLTSTGTDNVNPTWSPDGTRVAFQSYRDGQAEIYLMNADGSNSMRLTADPGYDGEPAWSPEGDQIAFDSNRQGNGGIWVMNADGSGQHAIVLQDYAENPVWSPDGSLIVFDADFNANGFLELAVASADGNLVNPIYTPATNFDSWAASWSPDGRYLLFTEIGFVYYNGNWYWTDAVAKTFDVSNGVTGQQFEDLTLWNPSIATTEILPPIASLQSLPINSASQFEVNWSGSDQGAAGLLNFDVEVKDGPNGAWSVWRSGIGYDSSTFTGSGGHTYFFRVRSRDRYGNLSTWTDGTTFTRVENLAPTAQITVPAYLGDNVSLYWQGADQGGSGVLGYDVQYRADGSQFWTGWLTGTVRTGSRFTAPLGNNYYFRVRAFDRAHNTGPWQVSASPAMLCKWVIQGQLHNNQGLPVSSAEISLTTQQVSQTGTFTTTINGPDGRYALCTDKEANDYTISWAKTGYGSLPPTTFTFSQPQEHKLTLPPADNLLVNGDFETGSLESWNVSGNLPARVVMDQYATGGFSARLGTTSTGLSAPKIISTERIPRSPMGMVMAPDDTAHFVWGEWNSAAGLTTYFHQTRNASGNWSVKEAFATTPIQTNFMDLVMDDHGYLNVGFGLTKLNYWSDWVIANCCSYWFIQRTPQGVWGQLQKVLQGSKYKSDFDVSSNGDIQYAASQPVGNSLHQKYFLLSANQSYWRDLLRLSTNAASPKPNLSADRQGGLNLLVTEKNSQGFNFTFKHRGADNTWQGSEILAQIQQFELYEDPSPLSVDETGAVHATWSQGSNGYYARRDSAGWWSPTVIFPNSGYRYIFNDEAGGTYMIGYKSTGYGSYFTEKTAGGQWAAPSFLMYHSFPIYSIAHKFDSAGQLHLLITLGDPNWTEIYYVKRAADGTWLERQMIASDYANQTTLYPSLEVDRNNQAHITWWHSLSNSLIGSVKYIGPETAAQNNVSYLTRQVSIPITMIAPTLSFMYQLQNAIPGPASFSVQIEGATGHTEVLSTTTVTQGWTHAWADLSAYTGQTISVRFALSQTAEYPYTWANVDDVTIGSSTADTWVSSAPDAALPGNQMIYAFSYGNQGGLPAEGVIITHTLPAEMSFISASPPISPSIHVTGTLQTLTWNLGTLAGNASGVIYITVALPLRLKPGALLLGTVNIHTLSSEPETANNTAQTRLFIGHRVFLPVIQKK